MTEPARHLRAGIAFFVATCVCGVVGYQLAGWNFADAVYMVVITIFGVGYGEVRPVQSAELRFFTSGLIVAGYGAAVYAVGAFVRSVTEGEIQRALGARRMTREIQRRTGHTIVCGYGRVGRMLAGRLASAGTEVVVVDSDPAKLAAAEAEGLLTVPGDAADESVLRTAGVEQAATLAAVLSSDASNVFVTLTATGMRPELTVIARAEDPASEAKLKRSGAEHVILPAAIGADRVANLVLRPSSEELLRGGRDLSEDLSEQLGQLGLHIEEMRIPDGSPLVGQPVRAIEIRGNHGFLIVGLVHPDGTATVNPDDEVLLQAGDKVIVLGTPTICPSSAAATSSRARSSTAARACGERRDRRPRGLRAGPRPTARTRLRGRCRGVAGAARRGRQ